MDLHDNDINNGNNRNDVNDVNDTNDNNNNDTGYLAYSMLRKHFLPLLQLVTETSARTLQKYNTN